MNNNELYIVNKRAALFEKFDKLRRRLGDNTTICYNSRDFDNTAIASDEDDAITGLDAAYEDEMLLCEFSEELWDVNEDDDCPESTDYDNKLDITDLATAVENGGKGAIGIIIKTLLLGLAPTASARKPLSVLRLASATPRMLLYNETNDKTDDDDDFHNFSSYHSKRIRRPQFYHWGCSILSRFCIHDEVLANSIVNDYDGLNCIFHIMETYKYVEFLQISCIGLLGSIASHYNDDKKGQLMPDIVNHILSSMEIYPNSSRLYYFSCYSIAKCFGPGFEKKRLSGGGINTLVHEIYDGIIKHVYDESAQNIGKDLLHFILGDKIAYQLIRRAKYLNMKNNAAAA